MQSCYSVNFQDVNVEEFGPEPTREEMRELASERLERILIDPDSRRVHWFDEYPKEGAVWNGLLGGGWEYGWVMRFGLNSRNRFGGYTGEKPYFVLKTADGQYYVNEIPPDDMLQVSNY